MLLVICCAFTLHAAMTNSNKRKAIPTAELKYLTKKCFTAFVL
jgi:hypothetical protein